MLAVAPYVHAKGPGPLPEPIRRVLIEADSITSRGGQDLYVAKGHVVISFGDAVLQADEVRLDRKQRKVEARGHVVFTKSRIVTTGDAANLRLDSSAGEIFEARMVFLKRGVKAKNSAKHGPADIEISVEGKKITKGQGDRFEIEKGFFTPCSCPLGEPPSWKLGCSRAKGDVNEGAWLVLPVFYVKDSPLFYLPALYMPLKERKSGLLWPRLAYIPKAGWNLGESLYLAPRKDFDITLDADVFTERGVRLGIETRYALSGRFHGRWYATYLYDWAVDDEKEAPHWTEVHRFTADVRHVQPLFKDWSLDLRLELLGDKNTSVYFADSLAKREAEFTESTLTLSKGKGDSFTGLQFSYYQDLKTGGPLFGDIASDPVVAGPDMVERTKARSHATVHRLPELRYSILPDRAWSLPVSWEMDVEFESRRRLGPSVARWMDRGDGFQELDPASLLGKLWRPGRVSSDERLVMDAKVTAPLSAGNRAFELEPYLRLAQVSTLKDEGPSHELVGRIFLEAGGTATLSAYRVFEANDSVDYKHLVETFLDYRYRPLDAVWNDSSSKGLELDDYDRFDPLHELVLGVSNRLLESRHGKGTPGRQRQIASIVLTQSLDFARRFSRDRLGLGRLEFGARYGPIHADLDIGVAPSDASLKEVLARVEARWKRFMRAGVQYDYLAKGGGYRFGWYPNPGKIHELVFKVGTELVRGLMAGFDVRYRISDDTLMATGASMYYVSPCSCWRFGLKAAMFPSERAPRIQFLLDLSKLGSFGG